MANIGNLYFGIGGDDKQLRKILEERKKDAIELQRLLSSFQVGVGKHKEAANLQEKQNKLELSNLKVQEAREKILGNSLLMQQKLNNLTEIGNTEKLKGLTLDRESLATIERKRVESANSDSRKNQINAAQVAKLEQDRINKEILGHQRLLTEIQRTEAAKRRVAMVGVQGQQSYMNSIGLTNRTIFNQKVLLSDLSRQLGIYFSIYQVGAFVKELAMVSGEFEKQRLSLAAILQNKDAAEKIFGQIKDLAVYSPFNFKELTNYAKQLSAYSIPADELYETMKRLADVSAGLGVDMNRIVLAYGQIRAASILKGTEMRQLAETGLPIVDMLIKKFKELGDKSITAADIFEKVSKKEIPFSMIKEIFESLTNEGGMFFQMQEIQATSLAGKISNLRDSYDIMLDSIGKANSDLLKGSVDGLMGLMDNWEKYWNILKGIIITYGTYRAAVFAMTTGIQVLTAVQKTYNLVMLASAISGSKLSAVIDLLTGKLENLSRATKVGLVLAAIVAIGYAIKSAYDNANKLDNELSEIAGKVKGDADASVASLDLLLIRLKNANQYSKEYKDIIGEINKKYGEFLPNLLQESESYSEIEAKLKGVTAAIYERAKALAYSQSVARLESELSETISKSYDSAMKSLTQKPMMGYEGYILSKDQANKVVADMFYAIRSSPEIYKQESEVEKLISETMAKAYSNIGRKGIKTSFVDLQDKPQLDGLIKGIKGYAEAFSLLPEKENDFAKALNAQYGANLNYAKSIEAIEQKYANLDAELSKKSFKTFPDDFESAKLENQKKKLEEIVQVYSQFGQVKLAGEAKAELEKLNNLTIGWKVELQKALGKTITITAESNFDEVVKEMKDKYKEIKTRMDEQKPILLKAGFDFKALSFPAPLEVSQSLMQMGKGFKADKEDADNLAKAVELIKMQLSDLFTPKEKGNKKDTFTEGLKLKIDLIKDAKKEYDELLKLMSKEDAFKTLTSIKEYEHVNVSDVSTEGYTTYLKKKIEEVEAHLKKNPKSSTAQTLLNALTKEVGGIQIGDITKKAKDEIDKIEKYLSQHKEKYNLYKQIFEITGDKGQAAQLAFGDLSASVTTYIDAMKNKLKEMSGGGIYEDLLNADKSTLTEPVNKLVEDIRQAIQEQDFALKLDMSQIIADYATTEERITAIHNKYEEKRAKARKSGQTEDEINKAVYAYDNAEKQEVEHLQEELLRLTPFYRQLFADLSDIGYRHLKKISDSAKSTIDIITNTKIPDPNNKDKEILKYGQYNESGKHTGYYLPNEDGTVSKTLISLREYEQMIKRIASIQKDMRKDNPFASLILPKEEYKNADGSQMDNLDIMASKAMDANAIIQQLGGSLGDMFSAMGNEDAADTTAFVAELAGSAMNIAAGIASGNPVQMIQGIIGGITSIAKQHDAKLDKAIKKSQLEVKRLKAAYSDLERFIGRQLGAVTTKQAKDQIKNLEAQKKEIQSQIRNEQDKKKSDAGVIQDYKNQISELNDQIRYFYEDLAGEQYGIKIKDWAKSIADSLVEAWAKGEDAAKAFDKSVADIMKSVFKNILQLQYIEPAMKNLRTYLFGNDGKSGVLGDGELSQSDMTGLVGQLTSLKGDLNQWQKAWDYLAEAAKQAGIDLEEKVSGESDTLSKGIKDITENTGNLLASYINAMRADLSAQKSMVERIMLYAERNKDTFALMQADIMRIQINTLATASNTARLVEISEESYSLLRRVSTSGSGVKFNIV